MADKYQSMSQLYANEPQKHYQVSHRKHPNSPVLILSPTVAELRPSLPTLPEKWLEMTSLCLTLPDG